MENKNRELEENIIMVEAENAGERLDSFLARHLGGMSRSQVQKLIRENRVLVNRKMPRQSYMLREGDCLEVSVPPPQEVETVPEPIPLEVVFEDENLLVVNKPRGMVVHPAPGHQRGTLVNALLHYCRDLSGIGGELRPGIVHRLDKDTSGLLVVAKGDATHRELSRQLKERTIKREYLVLVWGVPRKKLFKVSAPLARHPRHRKKMAVVEGGRGAETVFRVLARPGRISLLKARLGTGRTHQVRVHLSYVGHPVVGDPLYGGITPELQKMKWTGQALHARRLTFIHPRTGERLSFVAPLPEDFKNLLHRFRER